ncbi:DUF5336 domain-containing protein [Gordonia polyisoprenivorans]|uniref:DUF5336 domain-containing protein n=1 Tax=Gordonia polyisoprenivorans TaxID=84595 RepID=UPI001AD69B6B|nr:DUF5336 domain-containing protein [Gordonia polyisoprenivorans]QTI68372.1 DUF5336 domain-containing protein [Gordonia polyisoprenivorans]
MNPGDPNNPQQNWAAGYPAQPTAPQGQHGGPAPTQGFGQPGTPSGQWSTSGQQWGSPPAAPRRQFDARAQLPSILLVAAAVTGLITYFMGFVSWVVVDNNVSESQLDNWSQNFENGNSGVPGFASYEIVLNPGKFLIILGAIGVAAAVVLVPRFRKAVPFLAVIAAGAWLALFAAAVTTTSVPVIGVGTGAIVALIFGFLQVAFLLAAAVLGGVNRS